MCVNKIITPAQYSLLLRDPTANIRVNHSRLQDLGVWCGSVLSLTRLPTAPAGAGHGFLDDVKNVSIFTL
jgi:hypothetical protein